MCNVTYLFLNYTLRSTENCTKC